MKVLLVKTGTTVPNVASRRGDFETWFAAAMGLPAADLQVVSVYRDESLPESYDVDAIVVTGSAALVTDREPWSERTAGWLGKAVEGTTPVLCVCYGHQLLAHALGGQVEHNPMGRQIGTIDVTLTDVGHADPLFRDLPRTLHVPVSHVQSVTRLPPNARLLATSARDPHHAFAIGDHVWAVQFHPEFDAQIVRGYIESRWDAIESEGLEPRVLHQGTLDTADGTILLRRFAQLARG